MSLTYSEENVGGMILLLVSTHRTLVCFMCTAEERDTNWLSFNSRPARFEPMKQTLTCGRSPSKAHTSKLARVNAADASKANLHTLPRAKGPALDCLLSVMQMHRPLERLSKYVTTRDPRSLLIELLNSIDINMPREATHS